MEGIGLAASIIGIVETSWKIKNYIGSIKNSAKSRLLLLEEITLTWLIYQRLEGEIDLTKGELADETWVQPLKALDGSDGIASQVREQLEEISSRLNIPEGRFQKVMANLRWPFQEKEAMKIVERLHRLKETTIMLIQQSSFRLTQDLLHNLSNVNTVLGDTQFTKLLAWLTPLNFVRKQEEVLGAADPYSCDLLAFSPFRRWQEGQLRSLWCYGVPGAGKSVAAASVYAHLVRQYKEENVAVVIAFCSFDHEKSLSPQNVVASLLKQILQRRGSQHVPSKLTEEYTRATTTKDGQPLSLAAATEFLKDELQEFDETYVILDGLDEVRGNDRASMVEALHGIRAGVRIIITSRYLQDILEAFGKTQVCQSCRKEDNEAKAYWRSRDSATYVVCDSCHSARILSGTNEHQTLRELKWAKLKYRPSAKGIRAYVSTRLDSDRRLRNLLGPDSGEEELRALAINTVTSKAENIFLLARLHVDSLSECLTVGDLERTLNCLTGDLDQMYSESLKRMERGLTSRKHKELLDKLLTWIAWGQRPLSVAELGHALYVYAGIQDIRDRDILPVREITAWSAGLLFVDSNDRVRVIHPTTSRFFVERRNKLYPQGDRIIAHDCINYMKMVGLTTAYSGPDERIQFMLRCRRYPLIKYAVEHAFKHVARSEEKDDDDRVVLFLLNEANRKSFVQALYYLDKKWSINGDVSALHLAVHHGLVDVVERLIEEGGDVDSQDIYGATPLMYDANRGDEALPELKSLLKAGADASIQCSVGSTALMRAVASGAERFVTRLLRQPDVNINAVPSNDNFLPALVGAIKTSNDAILKKLLSHKDVDANFTGQDRPSILTPLHYAAIRNKVSALKLLLKHKDIKVDIPDSSQGWTPLFYSSTSEVAGLLLDHGADIDFQDNYKGTALMRAVDNHAQEVVELLIRRGADVNRQDMLGRTVLHSAAVNNAWQAMEYIVRNVPSIDINAQGQQGETALHDSCEGNDIRAVKILVSAGARCDIRNKDGRTALEIAELRKSTRISEVLKKAKGYDGTDGMHIKKTLAEAVVADPVDVLQFRIANANIDDLHKSSAFHGAPLHQACEYGRADVAKMLLDAGSDTEIKNSFDRTPIFMAITFGHLECVKLLLSYGADGDASPLTNFSLWEYAWSLGYREISMELIEYGARIDNTSVYMSVLLLQAVYDDNVVVARRLVEAGASIHQKLSGVTAMQLADIEKSREVLKYFSGLGDDDV
ncbi:hypothetical protein MCOR25_008537 [Pyricularia grisea]|nr:hypothetical protein MCOR25_008537 [Pyricularia grisea]